MPGYHPLLGKRQEHGVGRGDIYSWLSEQSTSKWDNFKARLQAIWKQDVEVREVRAEAGAQGISADFLVNVKR